jgi:hypothetical protein
VEMQAKIELMELACWLYRSNLALLFTSSSPSTDEQSFSGKQQDDLVMDASYMSSSNTS